MGLARGVMIARDDHGRNAMPGRQSMKLLGSYRHDSVERTNRMKQITCMYAEIGLQIDDPVHRLDEASDDVFLTDREPGLTTGRVVFSGAQMAI
jgi:hypothetical protein